MCVLGLHLELRPTNTDILSILLKGRLLLLVEAELEPGLVTEQGEIRQPISQSQRVEADGPDVGDVSVLFYLYTAVFSATMLLFDESSSIIVTRRVIREQTM